jgi:two-component system chemotaxis sensor kinase CheA
VNEQHEFAALLPHFLEETTPMLESLGTTLAALESAWSAGRRDAALETRAIGDVHTIKGNGAMMGFEPIQHAAHALEDLLQTTGAVDAAAGALLVRGGDLLHALVGACADGELDAAAAADYIRAVAAHLAGDGAAPIERPLRLAPIGKAAETVRVDFHRLDELSELADFTATAHAQLIALLDAGDLAAARACAPTVSAALHRVQSALVAARRTPLRPLFDRFGRYVRELARGKGQPIRLVVQGGDVAIDKTIVDRLGEPLLHVIRNAVAHGIEPVADRRAAGKTAEATIALAAETEEHKVVVTVGDDGRGLDLDAVAERARRLGVNPDHFDEAARRRLVFLPGLTTAAALSPLAGRGIGLDVVAGVIAGLGGKIDVQSRPGRGCTFRFELPLAPR